MSRCMVCENVQHVALVMQADMEGQARQMQEQITASQAAVAAAQAEKTAAQDHVQRLEGEKASVQRQLDEVSAQVQQERAKANDLESRGTVASAEAEVCRSWDSVAFTVACTY